MGDREVPKISSRNPFHYAVKELGATTWAHTNRHEAESIQNFGSVPLSPPLQGIGARYPVISRKHSAACSKNSFVLCRRAFSTSGGRPH